MHKKTSKKHFKKVSENKILLRAFRNAEISYAVTDVAKAAGPVIDLLFVSQFIGPDGVTVIGYTAPLIMFMELIGSAIANGARVKAGPLIGAGDREASNLCFSASLFFGIILALVFSGSVMVFSPEICKILGAREVSIGGLTKSYIIGYSIGMPFFVLNRILNPFLQLEGQYKRMNISAVVTTVVNVAADLFVIFVLHGGMFEIGIVTSISYFIGFVINASFYFQKRSTVFRFSLRGIRPRMCFELLYLGAPYGVLKASNTIGGIIINNLLTDMNMNYLVASYGVFMQIMFFCRASWYAPADTMLSFAGVFIGEENRDSLKETQSLSLRRALLYTGIVTIVMHIFSPLIARVFLKSNDPEAFTLAVECVRIECFSIPFHSIIYNFNNYLLAAKRQRFDSYYSFLIELGHLVPITFLLTRFIDYRGALIGRILSMLVTSLVAVLYIFSQKVGKTFRDKMLLMPEGFGIPKEDELINNTDSPEDILDLSRIAIAFALEHGSDKKRAMKFGLLTEELAGFLMEHGFKDEKKHNIEARIVAKAGDLIIRMRDDCRPLNLVEYYHLIKDDGDMETNLSLSIIMRQAKEVQYTNTFGANNILIRI